MTDDELEQALRESLEAGDGARRGHPAAPRLHRGPPAAAPASRAARSSLRPPGSS